MYKSLNGSGKNGFFKIFKRIKYLAFSKKIGVETTRRFLLEWLSFLHRYIPVGILESVTQQINLRPPKFFCRNQLESLFASPDCSGKNIIFKNFLFCLLNTF